MICQTPVSRRRLRSAIAFASAASSSASPSPGQPAEPCCVELVSPRPGSRLGFGGRLVGVVAVLLGRSRNAPADMRHQGLIARLDDQRLGAGSNSASAAWRARIPCSWKAMRSASAPQALVPRLTSSSCFVRSAPARIARSGVGAVRCIAALRPDDLHPLTAAAGEQRRRGRGEQGHSDAHRLLCARPSPVHAD